VTELYLSDSVYLSDKNSDMDMQAEKKSIIKKVMEIEDDSLIQALKALINYGLQKKAEQDLYNIPEKHKKLVQRRINEAKPEDYIEWTAAQKKLRLK
jgi:hypothetical protein